MDKMIHEGNVVATFYDENINQDVVVVKNEEESVRIPIADLRKSNGINYIGVNLEYIHDEIINGQLYGSVEAVTKMALNELRMAFEKTPEKVYLAKVLMFNDEVAKLRLNHYEVSLHYCNTTHAPIPMKDLLKVRDFIGVKIKSIKKEHVLVESVEYDSLPSVFDLTDLQEEDLVYGVVKQKNFSSKQVGDSFERKGHVYISTGYKEDVLTSTNCKYPAEIGQEVVVKINQISENRCRGKVLRVINSHDEHHSVKNAYQVNNEMNVGDNITGHVELVRYDNNLKMNVLIMISQGKKIMVPFSQLSCKDCEVKTIDWIGRFINIKVTSIGDMILGSKKEYDNEMRQLLISSWKQNSDEVKLAYVKEVGNIGYILEVDDEEVFLLKCDYSSSNHHSQPLKINDKIHVQLKSVQGDIIHVKNVSIHPEQDLIKLGITKKILSSTNKQDAPRYEGIITKLIKKGAYLSINDVTVFLPNYLFSFDFSRVMDHYEVGDCLNVRFHAYENNIILVRAVSRLKTRSGLLLEELKPGMLAQGVVRKIDEVQNLETGLTHHHIFTSIGLNLEALSPKSEYYDIKEGDSVIFKIKQVRLDGGIRGKIVRILGV